jgi:hypothetical protein
MLNFQQAISLMQENICNKCEESCSHCPWSIEAALKEVDIEQAVNE